MVIPMKFLLLSILVLSSVGCAVGLTQTKYMKVEGGWLKNRAEFNYDPIYSDLDQWWPSLGYSNKTIIKRENTSIEIVSKPHYEDMVSVGVILPVFPTSKDYKTTGGKWVRIKNLSEDGVVWIVGAEEESLLSYLEKKNSRMASFPFQENLEGWSHGRLSDIKRNSPESLAINPGGWVWIKLEPSSKSWISVSIGKSKYVVNFKESTGWVWHLVSV